MELFTEKHEWNKIVQLIKRWNTQGDLKFCFFPTLEPVCNPVLSGQFSKSRFFAHTNAVFVTCIRRPPLLRGRYQPSVIFLCHFYLYYKALILERTKTKPYVILCYLKLVTFTLLELHIERNNYEKTEWDILFWTLSHRNRVYRRRVEDNILRSTFTHPMLRVYTSNWFLAWSVFSFHLEPWPFDFAVHIISDIELTKHTHNWKDSVQHALDIRLKLFRKEHANTADSYHNLGATQHSLGDFHAALGSHQHALLLICLEKNKNAPLIVLMALH